MRTKLTDLQQLSFDTYKGQVQKYSVSEANDAIRKVIKDACGGEWNFYNFQKNKWDVYQVMAEILSIATGDIFIDQFNEFAEVHDVELGDSTTFLIENTDLFRVATIADGNTDIRRQNISGKKVTVSTDRVGIKIYTELDLFIAGRVDFAKMINRVTLSYNAEIGKRVYNAIYNSYSGLVAPYSDTGVFASDKLASMIAHVESKTGQKAVVYGTKKALGKITNATPSERMKDELNLMGHFGYFEGTVLLELPQAHVAGTDTFAVADDFLLVVPNGEKIVKIVLEGQPEVYDTPAGVRNDSQIEFFFSRKAGIGCLVGKTWAIYKIS